MNRQSLQDETKEDYTHWSVDPVICPRMAEMNVIQPIAIILTIQEFLQITKESLTVRSSLCSLVNTPLPTIDSTILRSHEGLDHTGILDVAREFRYFRKG